MLGKVLGAMIGAALGMLLAWSVAWAVVLGALGALVGHFAIDRVRTTAPTKPAAGSSKVDTVSPEELSLLQALCPLFIEVARADAPPVQMEIRVIREFFELQLGFGAAAMDEVRDALKAALTSPVMEVEPLATRARALLKPSLRVEIVRSLYALGLVDGDLQKSELEVLKRVVGRFNLSEEQLQEITSNYFGVGDASYRVLGVGRDASDDEVKSAYRRLATAHHPDRATDGGARFREIKEAYEALKKLRGL